jgi:hypothetical protein
MSFSYPVLTFNSASFGLSSSLAHICTAPIEFWSQRYSKLSGGCLNSTYSHKGPLTSCRTQCCYEVDTSEEIVRHVGAKHPTKSSSCRLYSPTRIRFGRGEIKVIHGQNGDRLPRISTYSLFFYRIPQP